MYQPIPGYFANKYCSAESPHDAQSKKNGNVALQDQTPYPLPVNSGNSGKDLYLTNLYFRIINVLC